jgi:hypothetical protein
MHTATFGPVHTYTRNAYNEPTAMLHAILQVTE